MIWIIGFLVAWVIVLTVDVWGLRKDIGQLDQEIHNLYAEILRRRK